MLRGDYGAAERILRSDSRRGAGDFGERAEWATLMATVLDDTGRSREADELVRQTVRAARALATRADRDRTIQLYARAIRAGALDRAQVETALGPRTQNPMPGYAFPEWEDGDLVLAATPDEARRALATMPEARPWWWSVEGRYHLARVRALASDFVGARRDAEALVKRCDTLDWAYLLPHAFFLLGEMRERTGDLAGAREAYETVIGRWGALKPKAVLADRARARLAAKAMR